MRIGRRAVLMAFALGLCGTPVVVHAQHAAVATQPQHIEATRTFLTTWGHQRWDDLRTVTGDKVMVKIGPDAYSLEPGAQKSDVRLTLPFRGLSTVRSDGKITGVQVDDLAFRVGDREMRGPATVELVEENGMFRVTGVSTLGAAQ